jgi:hypothetical protein
MQKVTLSAARIAIPALITISIVLMAARAEEGPPSTSSTESLKASPAILRDYPRSEAQPCLAGTPSCVSVYPPPSPCLVSIGRCSAHGHVEFAHAQSLQNFGAAISESTAGEGGR